MRFTHFPTADFRELSTTQNAHVVGRYEIIWNIIAKFFPTRDHLPLKNLNFRVSGTLPMRAIQRWPFKSRENLSIASYSR